MRTSPVQIRALLRQATAAMQGAGVPSPQVDARILAEHLLGTSLLSAPRELSGDQGQEFQREFRSLVARRVAREPLQHLTGVMHFRHLTLPAGPGVFIVRPETELLVDHALAELSTRPTARDGAETTTVVDLCTGSGAIALAVATERAQCHVWGVELSEVATAGARSSAARLSTELANCRSSVRIEQGDATAAHVLAHLDGQVDLVVSNPPYIPPGAIPRDPEVRDYDPPPALYGGGEDGLEIPAALLQRARALLRPRGVVLMEHADVQGAAARELAASMGYTDVRTLVDLTGRDRFLRAARPAEPDTEQDDEEGLERGEPTCLLPALCPECGAVPEDHRSACWRCGAEPDERRA